MLFLIGGRLYTWLELACRGRTHWTMFILGGLCFVIIGLLNEHLFPVGSGIDAAGSDRGSYNYSLGIIYGMRRQPVAWLGCMGLFRPAV